jgi:hypothetical protein
MQKRESRRGKNNDDDDDGNFEENEEVEGNTDMDHHCHVLFIERLYADILHLHDNNNKSPALLEKVKARYCNVSRDWVQIFTSTCPGCIERAPKPKPLAGLRNMIQSPMVVWSM